MGAAELAVLEPDIESMMEEADEGIIEEEAIELSIMLLLLESPSSCLRTNLSGTAAPRATLARVEESTTEVSMSRVRAKRWWSRENQREKGSLTLTLIAVRLRS